MSMKGFTLNVARSFLGKNVNLHLKDGSVIVNVQVAELRRDKLKGEVFVKCTPYGKAGALQIPLRSIAWAKLLDINLIEASGKQSS
ncbi:MAG: hypothetical protein QXO49_00535 [Candidatus Bathyarchaeia archaeon]